MLISPKTPRDDAVCDRRGEKKDEPTSGRREGRSEEAGGGRAGEGKTALSKWSEVRKGKKETRREAW